MELNSHTNTFVGGMNLDSDISLLKENQYTYAEDIRLLANENSTTGVLQSRDCLKKFEDSGIPESDIILGTEVTRIFKDNKSTECTVVITKTTEDTNSIYIIYVNDDSLVCDTVFENQPIGWLNRVKIVSNYESDTVSKIYVCDGVGQIKAVDLMLKYSNLNANHFDLSPNAQLPTPKLDKLTKGSLETGSVQYAYQLFTKHGAESPISSVSELILIPKVNSTETSKDVLGGVEGIRSNIGCQIKINFDKTQEFNLLRIYRIHYKKNNSTPNVYIICETEIHDGEIIYNDTSNSYISEITIDEFNMQTLTAFVPKTIVKHQNRLFAANIQQSLWDVEFDARTYRCDETGYTVLKHSDSTQNLEGELTSDGKINGVEIPSKHDCINPSNEVLTGDDGQKYIYGWFDNEKVIGGNGPNVSYKFCFTDAICSSNVPHVFGTAPNYEYQPRYALDLENTITTDIEIGITDYENSQVGAKRLNGNRVRLDYSDPYFTANFTGYQRDEIYRFGIVFYNEKQQKSPVHWIGDIKIPTDKIYSTFYFANYSYKWGTSLEPDHVELKARAIGLQFKVNNIPTDQGIVSWEIVRCPRTEIDRTIVTQALLSNLICFDSWENHSSVHFGDYDIRPMALPNTGSYDSDGYSYYNVSSINSNSYQHKRMKIADNYYELISPEISVSKNTIVDNLKNCVITPICYRDNIQYNEYEPLFSADAESDTQWGIRQSLIYPLTEGDENLVENGQGVGAYDLSDGINYLNFGLLEGNDYDEPSLIDADKRHGGALLLKYYVKNQMAMNTVFDTINIKNAVLPNLLPAIYDNDQAKAYATAIGDKIYVNTTVGGLHQLNSHGICAVIETDSNLGGFRSPYSAPIVNVKQTGVLYGGFNYENRINSTYISCVSHPVTDNEVCVFGGDVYLGVFDYVHTSMRQAKNDADTWRTCPLFINCYIPLESTVNVALFNNEDYHKTVNGMVAQNLLLNEPTVMSNYVQTLPLYEYNSAYSVDGNAQLFVPNLLYVDENPIFETRITCSELKTNNEIVDSWTKFKFANYIDVDNRYGPVTNLKSFNGKLFFWLDSATGVASVNERSLIKDNNISELTLGTGGILVRYDYYSTLNGSVVPNDRSICNSVSTLYWYDCAKSEICAINNSVIELSKVKGVKSWCNKLPKDKDATGWYDWKYNEVLFLHIFDDGQRSLVFNEQLNVFTGFYMYPVQYASALTDKLITLDAFGHVYLHGVDENYEPFNPKVTFIVNKGYPETKVFDNVWFDATLSNNAVLNSIVFKTKTLETTPINYENIEVREDTYRFPIGREKDGVGRMRGKYLICDYTFDCTKEDDLKIPYIKTTFRISRV